MHILGAVLGIVIFVRRVPPPSDTGPEARPPICHRIVVWVAPTDVDDPRPPPSTPLRARPSGVTPAKPATPAFGPNTPPKLLLKFANMPSRSLTEISAFDRPHDPVHLHSYSPLL
jgi:hypothetical protein